MKTSKRQRRLDKIGVKVAEFMVKETCPDSEWRRKLSDALALIGEVSTALGKRMEGQKQ